MVWVVEVSLATIYALCDSRVSDPVKRVRYVGQTRLPLEHRLRRHWVTAIAGAKEHRAAWMRAVKAAGGDVSIVALAVVPAVEADVAESAHIAQFSSLGCDLTNRTEGGRGRRGWEVSLETRQKMRESAARRRATPATRQRMSEAIRNSEAHKRHRERLHRLNRRPCPLQTRQRISAALKGERNGQNVLTWDVVRQIRERYAAGAVQTHLALEFECSPATIHGVVHGLRWVSA